MQVIHPQVLKKEFDKQIDDAEIYFYPEGPQYKYEECTSIQEWDEKEESSGMGGQDEKVLSEK